MRHSFQRHGLRSFTLVEMLAVIAVIAILAGLTISAFSGVMKTAARSRTRTEIKAFSTALESYKADNGAFPIPISPVFSSAGSYDNSGYNAALYQASSAQLYESLTGQTNYGEPPPTPASGIVIYYAFKPSQLGNDTAATAANGPVYIKDPLGNSYGYFPGYVSSGTTNAPINGYGSFDLWSTGGDATDAMTNTWIDNWGT
jgi:prepilin-type N-terminal cleavage/methylation domain-containing protein